MIATEFDLLQPLTTSSIWIFPTFNASYFSLTVLNLINGIRPLMCAVAALDNGAISLTHYSRNTAICNWCVSVAGVLHSALKVPLQRRSDGVWDLCVM